MVSTHLMNTPWSLSVRKFVDPPCIDAIASAAIRLLSDANARDLAIPAWSCSLLSRVPSNGTLLDAIAASALRKISALHSREIWRTAWAVSVLQLKNAGPFCDAISASARPKLTDVARQRLARSSWAFSNLEFGHFPLLTATASEARRRIREKRASGNDDVQDLANLSWAFSVRVILVLPAINAIASASIPPRSAFTAPELSNLSWA